jgi:hypothetical protein
VKLRPSTAATKRHIDIWAWRKMVEWDREGIWFVQHSSVAFLTAESCSSKEGELAKEVMNFVSRSIAFIPYGSLTCRKILPHGTDGFTSPPKEGVLRIFIALKHPSPLAGFEPRNLVSSGKHASH